MRDWLIEVRGWPSSAPSTKVRGEGGRAGLGPVDKSEEVGAVLAWDLSINVRGWGAGLARAWASPGSPKIWARSKAP